jgi:Tfp pilus assembly PilM family ATPase
VKRGGPGLLTGATRRLGGRARSWLVDPELPLLGLEFHRRSVAAVRLTREGGGRALAAAATAALPEEALIPSMTQANVADPEGLRAVVRGVVERVGGLTARHVALALPDTVARVVVLSGKDVEASKGALSEDIVRFKLREKVPFDMRGAHVVWRAIDADGERSILVVALLRSVLAEYEGLCSALGLEAGLVEVGSLALLRGTSEQRASGDWLLLNWDEDHASVSLSRKGVPVLVRTLVGRAGTTEVLRELANTILYYRDRLGGSALTGALLRSSALPAGEAAQVVEEQLGLTPRVIDPLAALGAKDTDGTGQALAAVGTGLLAGVS